ncbi:MAG TPA: hypothetical protein VGN23_13740 [Verrucomicrobiae bacterium]|jgi:hypothetical protein
MQFNDAMNRAFYIALAVILLVAHNGSCETGTDNNALLFYIVSDQNVAGGHFVDTPDFPKLGYISLKPELTITHLERVTEIVKHTDAVLVDKNGKRTVAPMDQPALNIQFSPEDVTKFGELTKQNYGKQMFVMIGNVPLLAATIDSPILSKSFDLSIPEHSRLKTIEDKLKKLVH